MKRAGLLSLFVALTACSTINGGSQQPGPIPPFEGSMSPVRVNRPNVVPNVLAEHHVDQRRGFDRVEFEFERRALPGYTVRYVSDPGRICRTGQRTEVRGTRFIQVVFEPTDSDVPDTWQSTNFTNLRGVRQTCARAGEVTYIIGLANREPFRVIELQNPPRVVIDVAHPGVERVSDAEHPWIVDGVTLAKE